MTIKLNCGVYQIRNIVTEFCYAGQSIHLKDRPSVHWSLLKNNKHDNIHLQRSYNKHGRDKFVFEILLYCEPKELTRYEQFFVDKYIALKISYNICRECVDSTRGTKHTEETRNKMRNAWKNRSVVTEETRKRMSESAKNKPPTTEETRRNMSRANSGENNSMFGRKGKDSPRFGMHDTEETCRKISNTLR